VPARLPLVACLAAALLIASPATSDADNAGGQEPTQQQTQPQTQQRTQPSTPGSRTTSGDIPAPVLPRKMRGRAAADALGDRLPAVAARNDLSGPRLERLLTEDETAWLSREGQLFYQEEIPAQTGGTGSGTAPEAAYATTQTFALHSRPGASRTIFLDFDGASVSNTGWNVGTNAIANGTHIGWDSDGSPGSFSSTEHDWIQEVWRQVAETYAPFDVDVTTQDPGPDGYTRSTSGDTTYGTRVVITSSTLAVAQACSGSCLGIAWVGTFNNIDPNRYYQPAWVFAANPTLRPMIVAQAASHEAGHTLGLHHDGTQNASYYAGTAAWGPIMGSSSTRAISQFSRGEYVGANNTEDDFAVMQGKGLPLRADDHGNSTITSTQLGARTAYDVSGVISTRTDTDLVAINVSCPTNLVVAATGIGPQAALNLSLDVLDAAGNKLATSSPTSAYAGWPPVSTGMNAQVSLPAAQGTYYLRVDGVGQGAPATTVWSDYGSLGQWRLTSNGCVTAQSPPTDAPDEPPVAPATTPTATPTATPAPKPVLKRPGAPVIRAGSSGTKGGVSTAVARWWAPTTTGGTPVTKYRVRAQRRNSDNRVVATKYSSYLSPKARSRTLRLAKGRYTFAVMTWNKVGPSAWSRTSAAVRAR
jgi:hypothetical protein